MKAVQDKIIMKCHSLAQSKDLKIVEIFEPVNEILGDKEFIAGETLTYADFTFYELCEYGNHLSFGDLFMRYPVIVKYIRKMRQLEKLKEYLESG